MAACVFLLGCFLFVFLRKCPNWYFGGDPDYSLDTGIFWSISKAIMDVFGLDRGVISPLVLDEFG